MAITKKKHNGLTLIELLVTMIIVGIAGLAVTMQFVSEYKLRSAIQPRMALANNAVTAMNHMTRLLRFARADTVDVATVPNEISATILDGFLPSTANDIDVHYTLDTQTGILTFDIDGDGVDPYEIARDITAFEGNFDNNPDLRITLLAQDENDSFPMQTTIMVMGSTQ